MKKLFKYQQELVDKAPKNFGLFWDMGLGKTITSIEIWKKYYGEVHKLFVLCPVMIVNDWVRAFEDQTGFKAIPYKQAVKEASKLQLELEVYLEYKDIKCVVLNYDMVWRISEYEWLNEDYMIICDESHRIKNPSSKIGKYMKFLKYKTKYKLCLTGTPQSGGYIDFYNQLWFLDIIDMTFSSFKDRYCIYDNKMFNGVKIKQLVGYKNIEEFEKLYLSQCEFLKVERVYDDVVKYNYVDVETTKEYQRVLKDRVIYYDSFGDVVTDRDEIEKYLEDGSSDIILCAKALDNPGAYRAGLRQLLNNKNKLSWLQNFLENYDKRVVIFYNFNVEVDSISELCEKLYRPYSVVNGAGRNFDNFKNNENGVCICNYKSGSTGINDLVISNMFIAYSPSDNYIEWEQSKKRIDREGQLNTPIYYFLRSGIEDRIYYALSQGKNFDDKLFISELESDLIK